jgi:hypothetical protein
MTANTPSPPKLLDQVRERLRLMHYSISVWFRTILSLSAAGLYSEQKVSYGQ